MPSYKVKVLTRGRNVQTVWVVAKNFHYAEEKARKYFEIRANIEKSEAYRPVPVEPVYSIELRPMDVAEGEHRATTQPMAEHLVSVTGAKIDDGLGWLNLYERSGGTVQSGGIYPTQQMADQVSGDKQDRRFACVPVAWERPLPAPGDMKWAVVVEDEFVMGGTSQMFVVRGINKASAIGVVEACNRGTTGGTAGGKPYQSPRRYFYAVKPDWYRLGHEKLPR